MRLYEIPSDSIIQVNCSDGSSHIKFHHMDGLFSFCTSELGNPVHLHALTELAQSMDGTYTIVEEGEPPPEKL